MIQGGTYSGTLNTTYGSEYVRMWIDSNNDGTFSNSEQVYASPGSIATYSATTSYSIAIPANAPVGLHRFRVRNAYLYDPLLPSYASSSIPPCATLYYGETRDYLVNILSSIPPPPVVTTAPVCPGDTLRITATDTSGFPGPITFNLSGPFTGSPIANSVSGAFKIPNATAANAGTYIVSMNSGSSTSNPVAITTTVYPAAALTISAIQSPTTCAGANGSFQINGLLANTSYTLKYRNTTGTTITTTIPSTTGTTYTVSNLGAGTYDSIRVTTVGGGGCTSNYTIAVVPAPNPPATPIPVHKTPLCPGDTLKLSISNITAYPSGSTFTWTGPNGFSSTSPTPTRPNMTSANNGNYTVFVTVNSCVSAIGKDSVVVSSPDPLPIPISPTYCQFDPALPLAAQGINLTFYGPAAPNPANSPDSTNIARNPAQVPRTDIPGIYIYYVTQQATCVSGRAFIQVTVKSKPPKPNVPQTAIDYCQFSPASPLSASGTNIRWYATPTGGTGTATAPTPNTLVSGTFFYYVSQTVNGCESDRQAIVITVKPKPAPPKVQSPLNLCQGDPFAPVTAIGQNLLWYTGPTGGVGVPVAPIPNTGYEDSFRYWVSQSVNGCESDRALLSVFVNYKPNGIIVGSNQWVCQFDTLSFYYYGNGRPDAQYVWYAPYPSSVILSGGNTRGPLLVRFDTVGTSVIRLQINNKGCISTLIAAPITVRHLPKIDYSLKQDVCVDELVNIALVATEPGVSTYAFDFGSSDTTMVYSAVPGGPFGIRYHTPGTYTVAATATLNMCTSLPLEKDIYVHANPDATIIPPAGFDPNKPICASDTLNLAVKAVQGGATYTWTPAAYFQSYTDTLNYLVRGVVSRTSYVKVRVRTAYGCESEDSLLVNTKPCCNVYFPNAFAPDGNIEQNRRFKPITAGFHDVNTFKVINRWGQVMYETKSLPHSVNSGWDGTFNGVKQDMGTYFWYISYKCEGKMMDDHGEVILVR